MNHPQAVGEKAQHLEQLLQRVEAGEAFEPVRAELDLRIQEKDLPELRAKYEAGGRKWEALIDGRYGHPQTAHGALREWMYERKREDESLTARELGEEIAERFGVQLSEGHTNYLLRKMELTRPPGRPNRGGKPTGSEVVSTPTASPDHSLENGGIFFPGSGQARDGDYRGRGAAYGDGPAGVRGDPSGSIAADSGE